ncbi:MAG: 4'-phosphopantetheinyl transferase superfamily protein [Ilumatobacteraceae bacterium]|nr:4'-phosphopantetheinyl transferase superfamily protein [Ilumatobacteraceae bacterium]
MTNPGLNISDERSSAEMLGLLSEQLHLWIVPISGPLDPSWVAANEVILSEEERGRHRRYRRASDRDLFLAAHAVVRHVLSRYASIPPGEWVFETNQYGRPEIANLGVPRGLRFNLSHTDGMIALIVHDEVDTGVDVERVGRLDDLHSVSKTVFADSERSDFLALSEADQTERFYRLWTLKEAFIKAKGMGLSLPLKDFWFESVGPSSVTFSCREEVEPDPAAWHFTIAQPSPHHRLATACRSGSDRHPRKVESLSISL